MSDASDAVLLTADDGHGQTYVLADPTQLSERSMILSDGDGFPIALVDREAFLASGYSVTVGQPDDAKAGKQRRRFGRKGKGA